MYAVNVVTPSNKNSHYLEKFGSNMVVFGDAQGLMGRTTRQKQYIQDTGKRPNQL